jgi:hypothetical protein
MAKLGEQFVEHMIDLGPREVGGFFYPDSNIAQPTYPRRPIKEIAAPGADEREKSILDEHLERISQSRDDPGRDDRDQGIERE